MSSKEFSPSEAAERRRRYEEAARHRAHPETYLQSKKLARTLRTCKPAQPPAPGLVVDPWSYREAAPPGTSG